MIQVKIYSTSVFWRTSQMNWLVSYFLPHTEDSIPEYRMPPRRRLKRSKCTRILGTVDRVYGSADRHRGNGISAICPLAKPFSRGFQSAYPNSRLTKHARTVRTTLPKAITPIKTPVRTLSGIVKISSEGASGSVVMRDVVRSPRIVRNSYIFLSVLKGIREGGTHHHDCVA